MESEKSYAYLERLKAALSPGLIALASLLLLGYVGLGETLRSYPALQHDRLAAQGEIIQKEINTFLQAGLPLRQFVGFETLSTPLMNSDELLQSIVVSDLRGNTLFASNVEGIDPVRPAADQSLPLKAPGSDASPLFTIQETSEYFIAVLPLENKFETVGFLSISLDKVSIFAQVKERFGMVFLVMLGLALVVLVGAFFLHGMRATVATRWLQPFFAMVFIVAAVVVTTLTVQIYSHGVQAKASALADSLATRVGSVFDLGLSLDDISGIDQALIEYHQRNPELDSVALTLNGQTQYHTEEKLIGVKWVEPENCFVFQKTLSTNDAGKVDLVLAVPKNVVYSRVARNIKNFAVLFLATVFLTALFFKLSGVLEERRRKRAMAETLTTDTDASEHDRSHELEFDSDSSKAYRLALITRARTLLAFLT